MEKPKHIFLIVTDSLRKDAVYNSDYGGVQMPYVEENSIQFTQARSSGCWTLPATACMFTGLNIHEHGANTQSRQLRKDIPTLAEKMKEKGYKTIQLTGNPVTTDIFGLDRGFDETYKVWKMVTPRLKKTMRLLLAMGKPRVRRMIFSKKDAVSSKLTEDLEVANCWGQNTHLDNFDKVYELIEENDKLGQPCFFFLNLMETHFPYHISDTFKLSGKNLLEKAQEAVSLYKFVNQSFLTSDKEIIKKKYREMIYQRQMTSYQIIHRDVNDFIRNIHKDKSSLVVFCSDHGDNFGELDWYYHFSNVNDSGNRVPLFWLNPNGDESKFIDTPISARFIYQSLLEAIGFPQESTLFKDNGKTYPTIQSYWYKHASGTLAKYKYNQFLFEDNHIRFVKRNSQWLTAPITQDEYHKEMPFEPLPTGTNPIEEHVVDAEKKKKLLEDYKNWDAFSSKLL